LYTWDRKLRSKFSRYISRVIFSAASLHNGTIVCVAYITLIHLLAWHAAYSANSLLNTDIHNTNLCCTAMFESLPQI